MPTADNEHPILLAPSRLVSDTRLEFRREALEHLEHTLRQALTRVVVDLCNTSEVDASGLGVLVLLQKRARERMIATKLLHAPAALKQMLELTRLAYLFEIED